MLPDVDTLCFQWVDSEKTKWKLSQSPIDNSQYGHKDAQEPFSAVPAGKQSKEQLP